VNIFLIGDTHFGHPNIITFKRSDNSLLRPNLESIHHHDEQLVHNWNSVVKVTDKVYHLGDVGFKNFTHMHQIFVRLHGEKILIKGNHDIHKLSQYAQIFKDVRGSHVLDKNLLTHIPVHPYSKGRWKSNIHGHLHDKIIDDPWYINVSAEQINLTPISYEELKKKHGL